MAGENLPITPRVQSFRTGPRPGGMAFDALLRRAGIRYGDLT